jgi:hypothetical protein
MNIKEAFVIETLREADHDTNRNLADKSVSVRCSFERPRRCLYTNIVMYLKGAVCEDGRVFRSILSHLKNYFNSDIITMIIVIMIMMWRNTQCIIKRK